MKTIAPILAAALLAGCATHGAPAAEPPGSHPDERPLAYARLGQTVRVDGPTVTPLALIEDSRCPENARCVWAGRVRISATIRTGAGEQRRELTLGEPIPVADGQLLLADVIPPKRAEAAVSSGDYRFGFLFDGGL